MEEEKLENQEMNVEESHAPVEPMEHKMDMGQEEHKMESKGFKAYIPLIGVFLLIIAITIGRQYYAGRYTLMMTLTTFMGNFFLIFGFLKIIDLKGFTEIYSSYDIIASRWKMWGTVYPLIEIGLAYMFLMNTNLLVANIITVVIMAIGSIGVYKALKRKIKCACLGSVFKIPLTKVTLFEDILMLVMAVIMINLLV